MAMCNYLPTSKTFPPYPWDVKKGRGQFAVEKGGNGGGELRSHNALGREGGSGGGVGVGNHRAAEAILSVRDKFDLLKGDHLSVRADVQALERGMAEIEKELLVLGVGNKEDPPAGLSGEEKKDPRLEPKDEEETSATTGRRSALDPPEEKMHPSTLDDRSDVLLSAVLQMSGGDRNGVLFLVDEPVWGWEASKATVEEEDHSDEYESHGDSGECDESHNSEEEEEVASSGGAAGTASTKRSKRAEKRRRYRENKRAKKETEADTSNNESSPGGSAAPGGGPQRHDPVDAGRMPTIVAQWQSSTARVGRVMTYMAQRHGLVGFASSPKGTAHGHGHVRAGRTPRRGAQRHGPVGRSGFASRRAGLPRSIGRRDGRSFAPKRLARMSRLVAAAALLLHFSGLKGWMHRQGTTIARAAAAPASQEGTLSETEHNEESRTTFPSAEGTPCPKLLNLFDSYNIGERATLDGQVIEKGDVGWAVIGSCEDGMYVAPSFQGTSESPSKRPAVVDSVVLTDPFKRTPGPSEEASSALPSDAPSSPSRTNLPSTAPMPEMMSVPPFVASMTPTVFVVSSTAPTAPVALPDKYDDPQHSPGTGSSKCNASPTTCGRGSVFQTDYRGSINVTKSGQECLRWDSENSYRKPQDYPNAGLEGNFCRNPDGDRRAWCQTDRERGGEYCDVPECYDLPNCAPQCGANAASCGRDSVLQTDYRGSVNVTKSGIECIRWDSEKSRFKPQDYPNAGLEGNFCRNPGGYPSGAWCYTNTTEENCDVPKCEELLSPNCEDAGSDNCYEFSQHCCNEDAEKCQCDYLTRACLLELANGTSELRAGYCRQAAESCCGGDIFDDIGKCGCDFYEPLCNAHPWDDVCYEAEITCCGDDEYNDSVHCNCDLYTHAKSQGYDDTLNRGKSSCVRSIGSDCTTQSQREALHTIHNATGGAHWLNQPGWITERDHCKWYGISCTDGHVTRIDLRSNNITGDFPSNALSKLCKLESMNLANNSLSGTMDGTDNSIIDVPVPSTAIFFNLRDLSYVDLSQNELSGEVDVLFAPALIHVNFSHNSFTSIDSFKPFKLSHKTLRVFDLSYGKIKQNLSDLMKKTPPNMERFIMSNNLIEGELSLVTLESLKEFNMASNRLSGGIPDISTAFPNLQELDLSNQKRVNATGLSGSIPDSLLNLRFLTSLKLGGNSLTGTILPVLGSYAQLEVLDLSDNNLTSTIPVQLGKLGGDLQLLNLSTNELSGQIPSELSRLQGAAVYLGGNSKLLDPAPLDLCFFSKFDLKPISGMCPQERNALKELYDSANGGEWAVNSFWADPYASHCTWSGITCNESNNTVKLELSGNGLSGTLSKRIGDLPFLEVLDLADNEIKGTIASEIGSLSNIERLRLNHNAFDQTMPELGNLTQLELVRLDGNRLSGSIPPIKLTFANVSSYISDCGKPSDRDDSSLSCEECTMCCNADGDCHPTEKSRVQKGNFKNYVQFGMAFLAMLLLAFVALALAIFIHDKKNKSSQSSVGEPSMRERDNEYALEIIGTDSVYQFILGRSPVRWAITLATVAMQLWMLFVFVQNAEFNPFSETEVIYHWKCPPDQNECTNTSRLDSSGWIIFGFSMGAHLLTEIIQGIQLIVLSGRERHDNQQRTTFFLGGLIKASTALFTIVISAIYNAATAKSNADIIMNCLAIVFVMDIDEYLYEIVSVINDDWARGMSGEDDESFAETGHAKTDEGDEIIQRLNEEIATLKEKLNQLIEHFPEIEKINNISHTGQAVGLI